MKNPLESLGWLNRLQMPLVLQNEIAECGLACLTMISNHHGKSLDLRTLRQRFPQSLRGMSLDQLVKTGREIGFNGRALRLDLEHLPDLQLPCILHWAKSHFVVLTKVTRNYITILDPASGKRNVKYVEVDRLFTGVAVELLPQNEFFAEPAVPRLRFRQLWTRISGLGNSLTAILLLSILIYFLALLAPLQLQMTIDDAIPAGDAAFLTTLFVAVLVLLIIQVSVSTLRALLILHVSNTVSFQISSNLFAHLLRLPIEFFERRHAGDIASRFVSLDKIRETLTTTFIESIVDGLLVISALCAMTLYNPLLATIAAASLSIYALTKWVTHGALKRSTAEQISANARKDTSFLESLRGITTIRQYGAESSRHGIWQNAFVASLNANSRVGWLTIVQSTVNQFFLNLDAILITFFGARAIIANELTVGVLTAVLSYRALFSQRGAALIDKIQLFGMVRLHLERVSDIALSEPEKSIVTSGANLAASEGHVEIKALEYRYGPFEKLVFSNINLSVEPGTTIAIVGSSGSGKSTLLKCLIGLAEPTSGKILIDGFNASMLAGDGSSIAAVLQSDGLFSGSIADNISFFSENFDLKAMINAASLAGLHHVVQAMPMQYETLIGDIGKSLSAGQQQRLMIARALYRNPRVLVLDEATSNLDVISERFINENIKRLKITRIIVAHRPETILTADRIYALEEGSLLEIPREKIVATLEKVRAAAIEQSDLNTPVRSPFDGSTL